MSVIFGTPLSTALVSRSSFTLTMSGVTSGQPIIVWVNVISTAATVSSIADTFPTPYIWTKVYAQSVAGTVNSGECWIGTAGAGTSGTLTVTMSGSTYCGGIAVSAIGADTSSLPIDVSGHQDDTSGSTTAASVSLTPSVSDEGAVYMMMSTSTGYTGTPTTPWVNTYCLYSTTNVGALATYAGPPSGSALSTSWACATTVASLAVGLILKAKMTTSTALALFGLIHAERVNGFETGSAGNGSGF